MSFGFGFGFPRPVPEQADQHSGDNLLLETGELILLENGVDAILLESA